MQKSLNRTDAKGKIQIICLKTVFEQEFNWIARLILDPKRLQIELLEVNSYLIKTSHINILMRVMMMVYIETVVYQ